MITFKEYAIQNAGIEIQTIDARELHTQLESKADFSTWFKNRVEKFEFVENKDYFAPVENGANNNAISGTCDFANKNNGAKQGGHNRKDYFVTFNMAKELGMVENNQKGREVRRYFIECQEKLMTAVAIPLEKDDLTKTIEETYIIEANTDKIKIIKKFLQSFGIKETKENIIKVYHDSTYFMKNHSEYLNEKDETMTIKTFVKRYQTTKEKKDTTKKIKKGLKKGGYVKKGEVTKKGYGIEGDPFGTCSKDRWKESLLVKLAK